MSLGRPQTRETPATGSFAHRRQLVIFGTVKRKPSAHLPSLFGRRTPVVGAVLYSRTMRNRLAITTCRRLKLRGGDCWNSGK